jgi:hypothetical protein
MKAKYTGTKRNTFMANALSPEKLKNHEERKYIEFIKVYCNEILNADPATANYNADQILEAVRGIAFAFPDPDYWEFKTFGDRAAVMRKNETTLICWIDVIEAL